MKLIYDCILSYYILSYIRHMKCKKVKSLLCSHCLGGGRSYPSLLSCLLGSWFALWTQLHSKSPRETMLSKRKNQRLLSTEKNVLSQILHPRHSETLARLHKTQLSSWNGYRARRAALIRMVKVTGSSHVPSLWVFLLLPASLSALSMCKSLLQTCGSNAINSQNHLR